LINHSKEYITALFLSCLEYFLFFYNSPYIKSFHWISFLGLFISLCGQFLRTAAIICAGSNFTHQISSGQKQANHRLVTSGVYKISRHPSYLGWFLWSLGSQILLSNPLCFVGFLIVSLKFFKERIELEEFWLVLFFGEDYEAYRERVPSRIPFLDSILKKKK
jgi:protein-S-isoprenylcysteine O-methyltransferase